MAATYFFYDLETSGLDPRDDRIMQFAGIRTDLELNPVGEPVNLMIKLTPDTVPDPGAVLVTGITPQSTLSDGLTEAEFLDHFYSEIVTPDTTFMGFNTVRFDDEFMRYLHWRNFYDPYEWQYKDGCSRWDLLDVVRMTRALRPDGIEWPFTEDGKPTNRLELITKLNGIDHYAAHDALSDVYATIAVAKLIREKQGKLFEYLRGVRHKKDVQALATGTQPFVYSSGKYANEYQKTAVVARFADHPQGRGVYVFDLRYDPADFASLTADELVERWRYTKDESAPARLPVKLLQFNRCPAVAPLGVLDDATRQRLDIDLDTVQKHLHSLRQHAGLADTVIEAVTLMDDERRKRYPASQDVDAQLYDGFVGDQDKVVERAIRAAKPDEIDGFASRLRDERLKGLLPRYKARNYPASLSDDERKAWELFRRQRLFDGGNNSRLARYFARLQELAATASEEQSYLLEELQLYGQSLMPSYDEFEQPDEA